MSGLGLIILAGSAVGSVVLIFVWPSLFDALFWFLFAGVIPGTNLVVPAGVMALIYLAALITLTSHAWRRGLYPGSARLLRAQDNAAARLNKPLKSGRAATTKPRRPISRHKPAV